MGIYMSVAKYEANYGLARKKCRAYVMILPWFLLTRTELGHFSRHSIVFAIGNSSALPPIFVFWLAFYGIFKNNGCQIELGFWLFVLVLRPNNILGHIRMGLNKLL